MNDTKNTISELEARLNFQKLYYESELTKLKKTNYGLEKQLEVLRRSSESQRKWAQELVEMLHDRDDEIARLKIKLSRLINRNV